MHITINATQRSRGGISAEASDMFPIYLLPTWRWQNNDLAESDQVRDYALQVAYKMHTWKDSPMCIALYTRTARREKDLIWTAALECDMRETGIVRSLPSSVSQCKASVSQCVMTRRLMHCQLSLPACSIVRNHWITPCFGRINTTTLDNIVTHIRARCKWHPTRKFRLVESYFTYARYLVVA